MFGSFFDLAYSFATFEHVNDLQKGWQAMINVLRPGGLLWSVASPLWFSPFGHHKSIFMKYPWAHIMHPTAQSLMEFCSDNNIIADDGVSMIHHINYIFNPSCFNRHSATAYHEAAAGLENVFLEKNDFDYVDGSAFEATIARLEAYGHSRLNLLAQTHRLIARRS
jgi:SAM-dependent methyltransferase